MNELTLKTKIACWKIWMMNNEDVVDYYGSNDFLF